MLVIDSFRGEIPVLGNQSLPNNAAQEAANCKFMHGELRPIIGLNTKFNTAGIVRSLFTDDGLRFFAWDKATRAYLSPTFEDAFDRVYFANSDGFFVTQASLMVSAAAGPSVPSSSWKVGVATPAAAPSYTLGDSATWKSAPDASVQISAYWMQDGARQADATLTLITEVTKWRQYDVTVDVASATAPNAADTVSSTTIEQFRMQVTSEVGDGSFTTGTQTITVNGEVELLGSASLRVIATDTVYPTPSAGQPTGVTQIKKNGNWYSYSEFYHAIISGKGIDDSGIMLTDPLLVWEVTIFSATKNETVHAFQQDRITVEETDATHFTIHLAYDVAETIAYVTTFENDWSEESAPSPAVLVDVDPIQVVSLTQAYTALVGGRTVSGMNVYRTYPTRGEARFILVNNAPSSAMSGSDYIYTDASTEPQTSIVLQSEEWDTPNALLAFLTYMGNGSFCGAVGRTLYMSEPYHPHAWPYSMSFPNAITNVIAIDGGVLVTTTAGPFLVDGVNPAQAGQTPMTAEQAGVGQRTAARLESHAVFASRDGLVTVAGASATLREFQQLYSRDSWREDFGTLLRNIVIESHDGMVLGIIDPASPNAVGSNDGFVLRIDEAPSFARLDLGVDAYGLYKSQTTDELFVGLADGFAELGTGSPLTYTWHSKDFHYPQPIGLSAAIVDVTGDVDVFVYADGVLIHTENITGAAGEEAFRITTDVDASVWSVKFTGTGVLRSVRMGPSFRSLARG